MRHQWILLTLLKQDPTVHLHQWMQLYILINDKKNLFLLFSHCEQGVSHPKCSYSAQDFLQLLNPSRHALNSSFSSRTRGQNGGMEEEDKTPLE